MQRKAFNFYRSYFEVFNLLKTDKEKSEFITALLEKQFLNKEPGKLSSMVSLAYKSQEHSIKAQIEGFIFKTGESFTPPTEGGTQGGIKGPSVQGKGEEKGEEKGKGKGKVQFVPPHIEEVVKFFEDNGYMNGERAWNYYNDADWKDSTGKPVKNWKQKMRGVWFRTENIKPKQKEKLPSLDEFINEMNIKYANGTPTQDPSA